MSSDILCLNGCGTTEDAASSDARPVEAPPAPPRGRAGSEILCGAGVGACFSDRLCGANTTGGVDEAPTDDEEFDEALAAKPEAGTRFWNRKVAFWRRDADKDVRSSSYLAEQSDWVPPPDEPEQVRKGSGFNVLVARDLQHTDEIILPPEDPVHVAGPARTRPGGEPARR